MLGLLERGLACAVCQAPAGADSALPYESMADILFLRMRRHLLHNGMARAFEDAIRAFRFGTLLRDLQLIDDRAADAIENAAEAAIDELYEQPSTDLPALRRALGMLKQCKPLRAVNERRAVRQLCHAYAYAVELLDAFARKRGVDEWFLDLTPAESLPTGLTLARRVAGTWFHAFFFKRYRTQGILAQAARTIKANVTAPLTPANRTLVWSTISWQPQPEWLNLLEGNV